MFYKVTMIEKNDTHREMIVKADGKEAAVEMVPAAKAFLFPGEDTSKYIAFPESVHIDVMGAQVPHWRITVIRPSGDVERDEWEECGPGRVEMTVEAESAESLCSTIGGTRSHRIRFRIRHTSFSREHIVCTHMYYSSTRHTQIFYCRSVDLMR